MNSKMWVFTSCNLAYLPQAMLLLESVRKVHEDCQFAIVLVEEKRRFPDPIESALGEFDQVIFPEDIWGKDRFVKLFPYNVVEACTAIKGPALTMLLDRGLPVVYLDPDVVVFNRLDSILNHLEAFSILLTPHQLDPVDPSGWGELHDERVSLLTGVFNFGFFAVAPTKVGKSFSNWWEYRTVENCFEYPEAGLFTDQKWGNLIPVLFPETMILRERGMNVASWNLHERDIHISDEGDLFVDSDPLVFFHFTKGRKGLQPVIQKSIENIYVASLWRWYLEKLELERSKFPHSDWSYARFRDGEKQLIDQYSRREFRSIGQRTVRASNPFYQYE